MPAMTVTATQGGTNGPAASLLLRVFVITGAKTVSGQTGGSANAQITGTAFTASITTSAGSNVYGGYSHNNSGNTETASNSTFVDNSSDVTNNEKYVTFKALGVTAGATTRGGTTSASSNGPVAMLEILPSGTLAEDGSAPGPADGSNTSTTAQTTASFTPPSGSLLVAIISSDGGTGTCTMTVTDNLASHLNWTEKVKNNPAGGDYAGVWLADVPAVGGYPPVPLPPEMFPPLSGVFGPYPPFWTESPGVPPPTPVSGEPGMFTGRKAPPAVIGQRQRTWYRTPPGILRVVQPAVFVGRHAPPAVVRERVRAWMAPVPGVIIVKGQAVSTFTGRRAPPAVIRERQRVFIAPVPGKIVLKGIGFVGFTGRRAPPAIVRDRQRVFAVNEPAPPLATAAPSFTGRKAPPAIIGQRQRVFLTVPPGVLFTVIPKLFTGRRAPPAVIGQRQRVWLPVPPGVQVASLHGPQFTGRSPARQAPFRRGAAFLAPLPIPVIVPSFTTVTERHATVTVIGQRQRVFAPPVPPGGRVVPGTSVAFGPPSRRFQPQQRSGPGRVAVPVYPATPFVPPAGTPGGPRLIVDTPPLLLVRLALMRGFEDDD